MNWVRFALILFAFMVATSQVMAGGGPNVSGAKLYIKQNDMNNAITVLEKEINEVNADNEDAWYLLGYIYARRSNYDKMLECFDKALELKPKFREKDKGIKISGDSGPKFRSEHGADLIMTVVWGEVLNSAVAKFNAAVNETDESQKETRFMAAADAFGSAIKIMPDSTIAHRNMAAAYMNIGKYDECIEPLKMALAKNPGDMEITKLLGQVYGITERDAEAVELFQGLWDDGIQTADVADQLARSYLKLDKKDEAVDIYKVAIKADPDNLGFRYNYGLLLLEAKDYTGAIEQLKAVYEQDPATGDVVYNLGAAYLNLGVSKREALADDSENKAYLEDFKMAMPYLEKALTDNPDNLPIWFSLGQISGQLNKIALAGYAFAKGDAKRQVLDGKVVVGMQSDQLKLILGEPVEQKPVESDLFAVTEWSYSPSSNGKVTIPDPINVYVDTESGRVDAIMVIK
jgi:tetratricopeptide (TPR) repeat protein